MMREISDEEMNQLRPLARNYSLMILKDGPKRHQPGVEKIIWEHARRNFQLRDAGLLSIVCPVGDDTEVDGIGIFNASVEETKALMDEDPGVMAGVFVYEVHPVRGFPGDSLPS